MALFDTTDSPGKEPGAFAVKFTYNTQRIEGSTLSLKDTSLLLEDGITPTSRPIVDVQEAEAHRTVFLDAIREKCLSMDLVLGWHRRLFEDTKEDIAGKIRDYNVGVSQSRFAPPPHQAVGGLIKDFFEWYDADKVALHPVELATLVHLRFVVIHPFGDGNGRVSRLMMNHVLHRSGYPMLDIEYRNRRSYYNALERSQTREDDLPFLRWFMTRYSGRMPVTGDVQKAARSGAAGLPDLGSFGESTPFIRGGIKANLNACEVAGWASLAGIRVAALIEVRLPSRTTCRCRMAALIRPSDTAMLWAPPGCARVQPYAFRLGTNQV